MTDRTRERVRERERYRDFSSADEVEVGMGKAHERGTAIY